jgi:hypothetical protein
LILLLQVQFNEPGLQEGQESHRSNEAPAAAGAAVCMMHRQPKCRSRWLVKLSSKKQLSSSRQRQQQAEAAATISALQQSVQQQEQQLQQQEQQLQQQEQQLQDQQRRMYQLRLAGQWFEAQIALREATERSDAADARYAAYMQQQQQQQQRDYLRPITP